MQILAQINNLRLSFLVLCSNGVQECIPLLPFCLNAEQIMILVVDFLVIYDKMVLSKLCYYDLAMLVLLLQDTIFSARCSLLHLIGCIFKKKEEITVGLTVRQCGDLS